MISFWICAVITFVSALVSLGYAAAGLRAAVADEITPSRYALSRSVALAATAAVALFTGSVAFVAGMAVAMIIVQAADAVIGVTLKDRVKTYGPAATAAANTAALVWMLAA
ncbi:hypothetical protein [Microbacterium sp.]|uniref:hypothetical protein n=1 Tax=Microbacterium sp. TaxID=51671 RepID=UPI003564A565